MEEALVLARTSSQVQIIHRRHTFRASKVLADRVLGHPKITVLWNSVVESFSGSDTDLQAVTIKNVDTQKTTKVAADAAFVAIGHTPNTEVFAPLLTRDDQGYVMRSTAHSSHTNVPGVFVCGDAADHVYRQAITSAGSGAMAALDAERWLSEKK